MARVTKAELERMLDEERDISFQLQRENRLLKDKLRFMEKHSAPGVISALVVATERVTDAVAHVLGDLEKVSQRYERRSRQEG